jgi:hypothetical protein
MRHPPYSRGVQHLMYVGDDHAGAPAPASLSTGDKVMGALALLGALQTKGVARVASVGIASWIAYKALHGRGLV